MRRTKIVATLGPSCGKYESLIQLYRAGMDIARLNLSHGEISWHRKLAHRMRRLFCEESDLDRPPALMFDTRGPEVRIASSGKDTRLKQDELVHITAIDTPAHPGMVPVPARPDRKMREIHLSTGNFAARISGGDSLLIGDDKTEFVVEQVLDSDSLVARCMAGGSVQEGDRVAFPGIRLDLPFLSQRDREDLDLAVECGVDWVALSFVQKAENVVEVKDHLHEAGKGKPGPAVMAKIETLAGYESLDDILLVADGVMVARGDLGSDYSAEDIPLIQKDIIRRCNDAGVPVVTATQMLESMIHSPRPTRAEASDVANAIIDGTDAVMLSAETAVGDHPARAVEVMRSIAERTEAGWAPPAQSRDPSAVDTVTDAVAGAAVNMSRQLEAEAILTPTRSGYTARMIARYRPPAPIRAVTTSPGVARQLAMVWGVSATVEEEADDVVAAAQEAVLRHKLVSPGSLVVITSGAPDGPGTTDSVQVRTLGTVLCRGTGIGSGHATGHALVAMGGGEADPEPDSGDILVITSWEPEFASLVQRVAAIVAEEPGLSSPAALAGLHRGIPVVVGAQDAMHHISPGDEITVDAQRGIIYSGRAALGDRR